MRLLLAMPSPRDLDDVICAWEKLEDDQLHVKYYKEWSAYQRIRNFFLEHKEYTHLAICPDDLVIKKQDLDILKEDLQKFDYPVISGMCNVNMDKPDLMNIMIGSIPAKFAKDRTPFSWEKYKNFKEDLTKVLFSGFPLMIIRRDVVEKIDFDSESKLEGIDPDMVVNLDIHFCHRCLENNIPIWVDRRARMIHLRNLTDLKVGRDGFPPQIWFKGGGVLQLLQRQERS